jgi:hypothetical protein
MFVFTTYAAVRRIEHNPLFGHRTREHADSEYRQSRHRYGSAGFLYWRRDVRFHDHAIELCAALADDCDGKRGRIERDAFSL